jgi:hypothetical protein
MLPCLMNLADVLSVPNPSLGPRNFSISRNPAFVQNPSLGASVSVQANAGVAGVTVAGVPITLQKTITAPHVLSAVVTAQNNLLNANTALAAATKSGNPAAINAAILAQQAAADAVDASGVATTISTPANPSFGVKNGGFTVVSTNVIPGTSLTNPFLDQDLI